MRKILSLLVCVTICATLFTVIVPTAHTESQIITWSDDIRLTTTSSFYPDVAVDGSNVHVVWSDFRDSNWEIYYKKSVDNGITWGSDTKLTNDSGKSLNPVIAIKGSVIHIVWHDNRDGDVEIYYKKSIDNGKTWSNDIRLTNTPATSGHPDIAVNGNNVHVVWMESYSIFYMKSTDNGQTWSSPIELPSTSLDSYCPSIAVRDNSIHVAWRDRYYLWVPGLGAKGDLIHTRSTNNGDSWDNSMVLATSYTYGWETVWKPGLVASGDNVHLLWFNKSGYSNEEEEADIYYKRSSDNGFSWNNEIRLTYTNSSTHPSVDVYGNNVYLAFRTIRTRALSFMLSSDDGNTWSPIITLSEELRVCVSLAMAAGDGYVHIVWYDEAPDVGNFTGRWSYSIFYKWVKILTPKSPEILVEKEFIPSEIMTISQGVISAINITNIGDVDITSMTITDEFVENMMLNNANEILVTITSDEGKVYAVMPEDLDVNLTNTDITISFELPLSVKPVVWENGKLQFGETTETGTGTLMISEPIEPTLKKILLSNRISASLECEV
jgi:hypothetical protein